MDQQKEFLKIALDSCHSTIAQNETEIKKLKEAMDIRNKIILQRDILLRGTAFLTL